MTDQDPVEGRRQEIRARAEKATDGPWQIIEDRYEPCDKYGEGESLVGEVAQRRIATTWHHPQLKGPLGVVNGYVTVMKVCGQKPHHGVSIREADAQFIAHAREDIPWLLAECDRLSASLGAREREIAHDRCHDVVCNGSRQQPRGSSGCSCDGRTQRAEAESARLLQALEGLIKEWREQQQLHRTAFERTDPKDAAWIEKMLTCSYTFGMCANELSEALASCVRHPEGAETRGQSSPDPTS